MSFSTQNNSTIPIDRWPEINSWPEIKQITADASKDLRLLLEKNGQLKNIFDFTALTDENVKAIFLWENEFTTKFKAFANKKITAETAADFLSEAGPIINKVSFALSNEKKNVIKMQADFINVAGKNEESMSNAAKGLMSYIKPVADNYTIVAKIYGTQRDIVLAIKAKLEKMVESPTSTPKLKPR